MFAYPTGLRLTNDGRDWARGVLPTCSFQSGFSGAPETVTDGSSAGGVAANAATFPNFITLDLGSKKRIYSSRIIGGSLNNSPSGGAIEWRNDPNGPWNLAIALRGGTQDTTYTFAGPVVARYWRMNITAAHGGGGNGSNVNYWDLLGSSATRASLRPDGIAGYSFLPDDLIPVVDRQFPGMRQRIPFGNDRIDYALGKTPVVDYAISNAVTRMTDGSDATSCDSSIASDYDHITIDLGVARRIFQTRWLFSGVSNSPNIAVVSYSHTGSDPWFPVVTWAAQVDTGILTLWYSEGVVARHWRMFAPGSQSGGGGLNTNTASLFGSPG